MSRLKLGTRNYYHGTESLGVAKEILQTMKLRGGGFSSRRMYSLTDSFETAEAFGPIVFCFTNLDNIVEVIYTEEWFKQHPRIADYVMGQGYNEATINYMSGETEYIGFGDLNFTESQLMEIFISDKFGDDEDILEAQNELSKINSNIKISC